MTTVFIAGSISITRLHDTVSERIAKIVSSDFNVVVGDADGADTSIQQCLRHLDATKVTVYCTGQIPRNNLGSWPVNMIQSGARPGSRAFFTAKDIEMARASDFGFMIWDCKSTGTLSNVFELLNDGKKSVVFINKLKNFITISGKQDMENLLHLMSDHARLKAEAKIGIASRLATLSQEQLALEVPSAQESLQLLEGQSTTASDATTLETESMKLRSTLISELKDYILHARLSQSQAARVFGVTQPRISDLTRGKVDLFGLDALVNMATMVGMRVELHVHRQV